ncbi:MAG TPA: TonB family protein [Sphingomicrobium sp.]|nr:TonB family protein [Sphingomicrobium sp.]
MPASADVGPRERLTALAAVAIVQLALGLALLNGLRVDVRQSGELVQRLVDIALPPKPPMVPIAPKPRLKAQHRSLSAPRAEPKPLGGSRGPQPAHSPATVSPIVAVRPTVAPSGGGAGTGPAAGAGAGGGAGGEGYGSDEGGADLEKIAGDIYPSDYPKRLGNAGIGGRVSVTFTVETNGRVTGCRVTRSSGIAELDALTCRLMEQRFLFRPSTDRYGRPIRDEVDWDHDWIAPRGG